MRTLALTLLAISFTVTLALPALADKGKLSDGDRAEILALTEKVETAIINKDLKLLQDCCDPWDGLWIDIGLSAGWFEPSPIIYYGWVQIPEMLKDDHLYFLGNADGSGYPVYGRAPEIIWRGREGVFEPDGECRQTIDDIRWPTEDGLSLADIMQKNDGRELDAFTREPANMVFYWEDKIHFVQYFYAGEDRDPQEPYDNDFWFLLFGRDPNSGHSQREWCLKGIAHLAGWGI
jgi:hypothetical protein